MDVDHLEVPEEIITTVTNPKKRIKQKINSSQSNELVILPPTETHSCHTSPMLEGDVNIIPLCLSSCGSRVWARRRDNYDLRKSRRLNRLAYAFFQRLVFGIVGLAEWG